MNRFNRGCLIAVMSVGMVATGFANTISCPSLLRGEYVVGQEIIGHSGESWRVAAAGEGDSYVLDHDLSWPYSAQWIGSKPGPQFFSYMSFSGVSQAPGCFYNDAEGSTILLLSGPLGYRCATAAGDFPGNCATNEFVK